MPQLTKDSTVPLYSGNSMPVLALGTWKLTEDTASAVENALELGYRMIDTSGDYHTQPGIATALKRTNVNRADLFITTKVEETENAYESTQKNVDELGLEYANLMLIHRPPKTGSGERLWEGLIRAQKEGLTRDIGVSNYDIEKIETLIKASGVKPVVNQIEWSPFGHSMRMREFCREHNIVIQAYSPLTRHQRLDDEDLAHIAKKYNKSPAQILIRWNLQLGVVPIVKARHANHQKENLDVFDFEISEVDIQALNDFNAGFSSFAEPLPYA